MSAVVITGIGELVTCDGTGDAGLGLRTDAALVIEDGRIAWIGDASAAPEADRRVDLGGRTGITLRRWAEK